MTFGAAFSSLETWREELYSGALHVAAQGVAQLLLVPIFAGQGAIVAARSQHVAAIVCLRGALEMLEKYENAPDDQAHAIGLELAGLEPAGDGPVMARARDTIAEVLGELDPEDARHARELLGEQWPRGRDGRKVSPTEIAKHAKPVRHLRPVRLAPSLEELPPSTRELAQLRELGSLWKLIAETHAARGGALDVPADVHARTLGAFARWCDDWKPGDPLCRCGVCGLVFEQGTAELKPWEALDHVAAHYADGERKELDS